LGYSRDGRPDCKQIVIALIVTQEGFPLSYEIFDGNRRDVTTLDEMLEVIERKYGKADRVWVFDRGIVSEENLATLRQRGGNYLVGTIKQKLNAFGRHLLEGGWDNVKGKVQVKLIPTQDGTETYVLAKSLGRKEKEHAMRHRALRGLMQDLAVIQKSLHNQTLVDPDLLMERLGRLKERWPGMHRFVSMRITKSPKLDLRWELKRDVLEKAQARDGAYLLRTNLVGKTPQELWTQYIQLTEVEASFRALKSEIRIRPMWHWISRRISAHVMIAFLGYALWVGLKHRLRAITQSMTPWQLLDQFGRIQLIEVWFDTRDGRRICLPRITQPEAVQRVLLAQLRWSLPQQPPPRIYSSSLKNVVET
jgi:transposase